MQVTTQYQLMLHPASLLTTYSIVTMALCVSVTIWPTVPTGARGGGGVTEGHTIAIVQRLLRKLLRNNV